MKQIIFFLLLTATMIGQTTVYKTPSGKKYHTATCRMVENKSTALSITDAGELGLEPCKICKPIAIQALISQSDKTSGTKISSTQCKGQTKKGTRCKHMTKIGNGYCYQHQPE